MGYISQTEIEMAAQSDMVISFKNKDAQAVHAELEALLGSHIKLKLSDENQTLESNAIDLGSLNNYMADDIAEAFKNLGISVIISCSNCDDCDIEDWTVEVKQSENGDWLKEETDKTQSIISGLLKGLLNQIDAENLTVEQIKSKIHSMI